ncbi:MAG: hypothetical protein ACTSX9_02985 [Candidatus Njordarchaeales archaeon]
MAPRLAGAKIIGSLFVLAGIFLILAGISSYITLPGLQTVLKDVATYLATVGAVRSVIYGILAMALGVGLIREEEWAAGGTFILLLVLLIDLIPQTWYLITSFSIANLPLAGWLYLATAIISVIILIYLIVAKGWR